MDDEDFAIGKVEKISKQQKIVDAVNALQGELTDGNCCFEDGDKYLHRTEKGNYCTLFPELSDSTLICTVEEFKECAMGMILHAGGSLYSMYMLWLRSNKNNCTQLQPKQIEWKNGDKCVWNSEECVFVGVSCVSSGVAVIELNNGNAFAKITLDRVHIDDLKKPPAKEKRWIIYDSNGNFCSEYNHKPEPFSKTRQIIEIEINV